LGALQHSNRIHVDRAAGFGETDGGDLVARPDRVGDVDQSGVALTGCHPVQDVGNRGLLAHRV